ncbi:MAG: choice-of-anchor R domain-containing protein [Bryobacteraceae bacterium]
MQRLCKIALSVLTVVCALATIPPGRAASVVYTNIKPGDTYVVGVGIGLNPFDGVYNYAGIGFQARQNYTFEGMELAVSLVSGPNELYVYLMSNLNGLPGVELEAFTLTDKMSTDSATGVVKIVSVVHPELLAGQEYWVVAVGGPTTFANWQQNVHDVTGPNVSGPSLTGLQRDANTNVVEALAVIGDVAP